MIDETDKAKPGRPKGTYTEHGLQRRRDILKAIKDLGKRQSYPPSAAQIQEITGGSFSSVQYNLRLLREMGYLEFEDGLVGRTLRRTDHDPKLRSLR